MLLYAPASKLEEPLARAFIATSVTSESNMNSSAPERGWYPDQRLTIEEAMDAYTRAPAWASFEEHIKGTLSAGMLADIAVFDTNLIDAGHSDPQKLLTAKVLYTIVGGRVVYQRETP